MQSLVERTGVERRATPRFYKNYNLFFYLKDSYKKSDSAFTKDIGRGGIRFTSSQAVEEGAELVFEISIPYIAPKKLILDGMVLSSKRAFPQEIYETRAQFNSLDEQADQLFDMMEKQNSKDQKVYGLS